MTLLLRLSPLIPFNLFNYLMGVTSVRLKQYSLGGFGMIPGTIVYVYFGTTISNISDAASGNFEGGILQLVLLIVGTFLAFIAVVYVSWVAKKEIKKVLKKNEEEKVAAEAAEGDLENRSQPNENIILNQGEPAELPAKRPISGDEPNVLPSIIPKTKNEKI